MAADEVRAKQQPDGTSRRVAGAPSYSPVHTRPPARRRPIRRAGRTDRRDPDCCAAEYLDQPVAPYTVDLALDENQVLRLGDTD